MRFKHALQDRLKNVIPPDELALLPRGFQTLSDVAIINLKPELLPYKGEIGAAYLDLLPYLKSVWYKVFGESKVVGTFRTPTGIEHLAGEQKSEVEVVENGVTFKHDFTKIIFSKGNITERSHLPKLVKPGERILDMFAGIGYFSLMIAKHANPAVVHACEINPVAYHYLVENIALNQVASVVYAYHGDCTDIVPELVNKQDFTADRIIMGVFPAPKQYLPVAFMAVKPGEGSVIHYEGEVREKNIEPLLQEVRDAIRDSAKLSRMELLDSRFVKNTGIRKQHVVLDLFIS